MRDRLVVLSLVLPFALVPAAAQGVRAERLAPYVPSPQPVVERMLEAAELKPYETVYDLGCGDGRILITAAREFNAKAVGVELSDKLVRQAQDQVRKLGLQNRVTVIEGDLMKVDLKPADVVTVYLLTSANEGLKPAFEQSLRKGARVVSHDFQIRGWRPERVETVEASNRTHTIYVYVM
ncbi:MAG TPA: methyltransferase domain-containing protein, partial [Polyangiaceae bacterium]|nr:methyltransferase domain-containing protein [Polyangiaceae bacterium]